MLYNVNIPDKLTSNVRLIRILKFKTMLRKITLFLSLLMVVSLAKAQVNNEIWDQLLTKHVRENGNVNYQGLSKDKAKLDKYLEQLSSNRPGSNASEKEKIAYWINVYNAFCIKLIVDHYPLESIQDLHPTVKIPGVNTIWKKDFFKIDGEKMSLHDVEHNILRKKFDEPRIHFAINCASYSCPKLRKEAYVANKLNVQLQDQAIHFINNPKKNKIKKDHVVISKIFQWFTGDFTKNGGLIDYLNKYSHKKINEDAKIDYMEYNWELNDASSS